ncbi:hypothetical protein JCM6882_004466 [Rhodosporidiobolus microsporus]
MSSSPSKLSTNPSTTTPVLPSDPSTDDHHSSSLSSFPGPGRCVFSLPYQEFYVSTAEAMRDKAAKAGGGKKVKEKKVRKRVEREWGERSQTLNLNTDLPLPVELEDTAAGNGKKEQSEQPVEVEGGDGGKHQAWQQDGEEESSEGE